MPELELPGIDAPAADSPPSPVAGPTTQEPFVPESAPGTPLPEDRATTEDLPAGLKPETEEAPSAPAAPAATPSKNAVQKRIDELTADKRRLERDLEIERAVARRLPSNGAQPQGEAPAQPPANAPEQPPAEPDRRKFASIEDYYDARADWRADMRIFTAQQNASRAAQVAVSRAQEQSSISQVVQAVAKVQDNLTAKLQTGKDRYPDFEEIIMSSAEHIVPLNVQVAIDQSDDPVGVSYYLAKNPTLLPKLAELSPFRLGATLARIGTAMTPAQSAISNAPPPGRPSGTRAATAGAYREDFSPEEHIAWERASGLRK